MVIYLGKVHGIFSKIPMVNYLGKVHGDFQTQKKVRVKNPMVIYLRILNRVIDFFKNQKKIRVQKNPHALFLSKLP